MNNIVKHTKKVKKKKQEIVRELPFDGLKKGAFVIDISSGNGQGEIYKVGKVTKKKLTLLSFGRYWDKDNNECEGWSHYGGFDIATWESRSYQKIDIKDDSEIKTFYEDAIMEAVKYKPSEEIEDISEEKALAVFDKKYLISLKDKAEAMYNKQKMLEAVLATKLYELSSYARKMNEQVEKLTRVIGQIELYLGIHEDVVQLQEGTIAENEIINIRQQILYIDEEVGITEDDGLDWKDIDKFDEWLLKKKNYLKMIPDEKGVVAIQVRRHDKDYGDVWLNGTQNELNKRTYLLIRNGENLYRIWANIKIRGRLFPKKDEFEPKPDSTGHVSAFFDKDVEKAKFYYRQNALVLQGLLDRSDLLKPHTPEISLFKPETHEGNINFIRDDEDLIPPDKLSYNDWKKKLNSQIKRGTRIFFTGFPYGHSRDDDWKERFPHRVWTKPGYGIYKVKYLVHQTYYSFHKPEKNEKKELNAFVCHYNPDDTVYTSYYESHERTKSIPFSLRYSDSFVFNYDLITLEEIEYYINSRIDRPNYLDMLPVLKGMKKMRLEELKWEKQFVKLLSGEMKCKEEKVWEAVNWWKTKNIWKRPIMEDDAKAVRMIRSKLKNERK